MNTFQKILNEPKGLDYFDLKHDSTNSLLLTFPKNRTGRWINVENNVRVTTNNPKYLIKAYIYMEVLQVFCREVPTALQIRIYFTEKD